MDIIESNGRKYISIDDYRDHLQDAINAVRLMTEGFNSVRSDAVVETLSVSMDFLESL